MRARLKHCSTKAVLNISYVSAPFLPSFTQNLMHTLCSCSSDIPHGTNNNQVLVHDSLRPKLIKVWEARWDHTLSQRERGSRTPPCKQGCPKVYPQPSKKISFWTCWSHLVIARNLFEMSGIINKPLLLHVDGCLYYLYFIIFFWDLLNNLNLFLYRMSCIS